MKQNLSRDLKLITKLEQTKQRYFQKLNCFIIISMTNGKWDAHFIICFDDFLNNLDKNSCEGHITDSKAECINANKA